MAEKQILISIGREFGSGGHAIAELMAERFGLPLYDRNILREIATEKNLDAASLEKYDELPKNRLLSRTVKGHSNSPEENLVRMQFDFLEKKAASGESFVIVGRCAESVLRKYEGLIALFILGNVEKRVERIAQEQRVTPAEAKLLLNDRDRKRKAYHNLYGEGKWGDSRNYDMTINSSRLGIEGTADMVEAYIRKRCAC